jgi:hypothetical protein
MLILYASLQLSAGWLMGDQSKRNMMPTATPTGVAAAVW